MNEFIKAAVIGHPISHSKSPVIHTHWVEKYGLHGSYEALDIKPEDLAEQLPKLMHEEGYKGFNLTLPHKELVLDVCDYVDETAKNIGAVNTVYVQDGKICGTNTDAFGFIESIKQHQPDFDFTAGPALVLGAGGAAKAIIAGLLEEGVPEVYLTNRTQSKAEALSQQNNKINIIEWNKKTNILPKLNFLVNTTSCGMVGQPDLDIDLTGLPVPALVNDIVYNPLQTPLLQAAEAQGCKAVQGIGMLIHQARPAFAKWFGVMPEWDDALVRKVL